MGYFKTRGIRNVFYICLSFFDSYHLWDDIMPNLYLSNGLVVRDAFTLTKPKMCGKHSDASITPICEILKPIIPTDEIKRLFDDDPD